MRVFSYFCSNSRLLHIKFVKHILYYISKILYLGFTFDREADTLDDMIGYTDSDFAGSKLNRKSTRGYVFMLVGVAISHLSKLSSIVTLSTYEAGYITIYKAK